MKHTSKVFRKESKDTATKIRTGYKEALGEKKGKVAAKESKKTAKSMHENFKKLGGTSDLKPYKKK